MTAPFQARVDRDLVVVSGPDATSFLQTLVSQDLDPVPVGATVHTLMLQPQGKLLADFRALHRDEHTWWCMCEGGFGAVLAAGLARFKIRVDAEITEVAVDAIAVRGAEAPPGTAAACIPVEWPAMPAFDAIGTPSEIAWLQTAVDLPNVDADLYERARILAGVPRQGLDVDERTIPQEAGLEADAVSFTKGCFVGQELVCRIDTRGHVNRYLRRLRAADGVLARGSEVRVAERAVGTVTSAAGDAALAMLRREIEPGAVVDAGGVFATVEALSE